MIALAAALHVAILAVWVWRGGMLPLGVAGLPPLAAALVEPLAALAAATLLPVLWAERRFPTDCRLCRFFRAALAVTTALALTVVLAPERFG